ncbi:katanin p80 WD40 repeat-containing subunit B1 [Trichonephila clavata]|uniref:Katanin p80 WD40 repeat-containing subunit B1 n=1 Tax=Trichonephila clavata TaxID=2740835 RepID=A0A8X6LZY8_TRICU|nr:katanin p80 WD40 repeat-containing subunit B1 [Trichonephila clavata]
MLKSYLLDSVEKYVFLTKVVNGLFYCDVNKQSFNQFFSYGLKIRSSFDDGDIEEDPSRMIERVEYLGNYPSDIENSILSSDIDLSKTHILGVDLSTFLQFLKSPWSAEEAAAESFN